MSINKKLFTQKMKMEIGILKQAYQRLEPQNDKSLFLVTFLMN